VDICAIFIIMENETNEVNVGGRPSVYCAEVAERICELIANTNMGLRAICRKLELCYSTVYKWTMPTSGTYRAKFRRMYLDAKEMQGAAIEEEIQELADDTSQDFMFQSGGKLVPNMANIARCKLRIAVKQWQLGRLALRNKEMPEGEERERQWWRMGDSFVDLGDQSTVDAWCAAEAWKKEKEKERLAAEAAAAALNEEPAPTPVATQESSWGNVSYSDIKDAVVLPAGSLVWNDDREAVDEQVAALREKYPPAAEKDDAIEG